MANATAKVNKALVRDRKFGKRSSVTLASALQFYTGAMVGMTTAGYLAKFDDTAAMLFVGLVRGDNGDPLLPASTAGDGTANLDYDRPTSFELAVSGVAVTDIGKPVYATFDNAGTLTYSGTTYSNLIGEVVDVVASGIALVEPAYDGVSGNHRLMVAKRLAATGAQTISKFDVGKVMFCANTATLTLTLPPIADCPAGSTLTFVKDHTSDTNAITLDGNASEIIDAATTLATMDAPYDTAILISNGVSWPILARDIA